MQLPKVFDRTIRYISEAVSRIFSPTDDSYPAVGIQPFEGESSKKSHSDPE